MNRYEPKHARCYCVAIAGAVATVAGTAYTMYNTNQQQKAAEEAQNMGTAEQKYGKKYEAPTYDDRVADSDSYIHQIGKDAMSMVGTSLADVMDYAGKINARGQAMRKKTAPNFYATMNQEGKNILDMEKGVVPTDVVQSINRIVAENLGGATNPSAPGGGFAMSATASDTARRLGLTSLDLMKTGMSMGPSWRTNVDSFLYTPEDAIQGLMFPALNVAQGTAQTQILRDQNEYIAAANAAKAGSMPDPQVTGGRNDALTFGALNAQLGNNQAEAMQGLINGTASLYTAVKPKPTTGTTGTQSWKYNASGQNSAYKNS